MKNNNEWWYSLPDSTREYLFITDMDTFWDASESDIVWEGLSESKKTEIRNAIERNPGDEISVKYALDLPGKYRIGHYLEKEIIQNQYDGKTPEEVWNAWTDGQKHHFIYDHSEEISDLARKNNDNVAGMFKFEQYSFKDLPESVTSVLQSHLEHGQYGKGGEVENDEFQEAAEFLMDKTVFSYSLGQLEPTEHKIKGVHITPKQFNQRHLFFSFYGNEWPHNFNDYDRFTEDQLGDFIAGEEVELKDSQGEPYIIALGDEFAGKGKKVDPNVAPNGITAEDVYLYYGAATPMPGEKNPEVMKRFNELHRALLYFHKTPGSKFYIGDTAAKGTKIENMENKNYYYLKIGNRIIETFGGFSMTGSTKGGQYIYEIISHSPSGVIVKEHTITKSKKTEPFEISFYDLTKYMNAEAKGYQVEGCPMENMRDEALLDMEIADIKNSFKIEEEKAEVRKKEEEVAQAKHEADILLKKATDTEAAAKDTIEAMEALVTKEHKDSEWQDGQVGPYKFQAKVYEVGSEYGIEGGRVSKLHIKDSTGKTIINYDRGWDIKPKTAAHKKIVKKILDLYPETSDQAGKGKKVGVKKGWLIEDEGGHRKVVEMQTKPKVGELVTTADFEGAKKTIVSKVIGTIKAGKGKKVRDSLTKKGRVAVGSRLDEFMWDAEELVYNMDPTAGWQKKVTSLLKKKGASQEEINKIIEDLPQLVNVDEEAGKGKKVEGEEYLNKSHGGFKYKVWKNGDKYYIDPEFLTEVTKTQDYKDVVYFDTTKEAVDYAEKAIDERKAGKGTKVGEFGKESVNRILNKALREYEKETGTKLFKKEAKIGKYYHFRLNNPKGVKKCAVPSWASDLAGSVYEGAKVTTCQKDGEWFAQNVMIPTKNISKLQARSYAQQIAIKIKK